MGCQSDQNWDLDYLSSVLLMYMSSKTGSLVTPVRTMIFGTLNPHSLFFPHGSNCTFVSFYCRFLNSNYLDSFGLRSIRDISSVLSTLTLDLKTHLSSPFPNSEDESLFQNFNCVSPSQLKLPELQRDLRSIRKGGKGMLCSKLV